MHTFYSYIIFDINHVMHSFINVYNIIEAELALIHFELQNPNAC